MGAYRNQLSTITLFHNNATSTRSTPLAYRKSTPTSLRALVRGHSTLLIDLETFSTNRTLLQKRQRLVARARGGPFNRRRLAQNYKPS